MEKENQKRICLVEDCNKPFHGKGYCSLHYNRLRKNGDPLSVQCIRGGQTKIPEYRIWSGMKSRCTNPNVEKFNRYGGRGITICERWMKSFFNFYEDMGKRPTQKHQIDRINNNGNYEPSNCRWILPAENSRNSTATKLTKKEVKEIRESYSFKKVTQKDLAEKYKVCTDTIQKIIHYELWSNV